MSVSVCDTPVAEKKNVLYHAVSQLITESQRGITVVIYRRSAMTTARKPASDWFISGRGGALVVSRSADPVWVFLKSRAEELLI
jgi:hypothetical protein